MSRKGNSANTNTGSAPKVQWQPSGQRMSVPSGQMKNVGKGDNMKQQSSGQRMSVPSGQLKKQ